MFQEGFSKIFHEGFNVDSKVFQEKFQVVLKKFHVAWHSSQIPEQKEG